MIIIGIMTIRKPYKLKIMFNNVWGNKDNEKIEWDRKCKRNRVRDRDNKDKGWLHSRKWRNNAEKSIDKK